MKQDWEIRKLNEVSTFIMGQAPHSKTYNNDGNGELFIRVGDFGDKYPSSNTYTTNPLVYGKEGDIFLCIVGATCGKVNYGIDGVITRSIAAIRPNEELDQDFLFYYFLGQYELYNKSSEGAAQPILNKTILSSFDFSLPPLDEQKRIVAKLDECFEAIDKARANVEKNLNNAKELFQSQLNQIFSQKGDGLVEKNLGEVCEKTYNIKWQENQDVELEYIDLSAVSRETLKITETVSINSSNAPSRAKKIIKTGDIIFATTRPTLKRVAKISNQYNNQICSTGYVVLRSRDEMIKPEIIFYYIQTDMFMDRMESIQRGTSYPAVTDKDVKETIFTFPDIKDVQEDIISRLDEIKAKTQSLEFNYQQELDALDELKKSILQKAFNGEL